ncbi:MAG: hypothetical protein NVSMB55_22600 [Mycobacteriales bacterium]
MSTPRTVLVLGGGGALGAYQAGALLSLAEHGVLPDALYGCSAGALNAAFLAVAPSIHRAQALVRWWCDSPATKLLAPSWPSRARGLAAAATGRSSGLLDARPLRRLVAQHVAAHDVSELAVPLSVTTTCLDCGAARHHGRGPLADVLAASCALPGLFAPVRLPDGHLHVDGGVLCGVPVQAALDAAGPHDRVLVLDCGLAPVTGRAGICAAVGVGAAGSEPGAGCSVPGARPRDAIGLYQAPVETSRGVLDVVLRAVTAARAAANTASVTAALADPRVQVLPHVADAWAAGLLARLPAGPRDVTGGTALAAAGHRAASAWLGARALVAS